MKTKILCVFVILGMLLSLTACGNSSHSANNNSNKGNNTENSTENSNSYEENNYNTQGDFQSSLLNMAIEGEWIFYSNYYDLRDGIKRTLVDGGEYSKYNIETVFSPNEHREEMAAKLGWNNSDFYEIEDIVSINNLQVVNNWVYWASECAIWRFPNTMDANVLDLELVAVIGVPERPTSTNFYVDGDWIYYACNAIKEQYDLSTALIEHTLCKKNLKTNEIVVIDSADSTKETLGDLSAAGYARYIKLIDLKTVCGDGRVYYTNYQKDNILCYKDGEILETSINAYTYCKDSYKYVATNLFASKNGNVFSMVKDCIVTDLGHSDDINYFNFQSKDTKLTDGEEIEDFSFLSDDGWYFEDTGGVYKFYFNSNDDDVKKITNDDIKSGYPTTCSACVCGDYLYYYTDSDTLCRMNANGGNWEDVSWMIS